MGATDSQGKTGSSPWSQAVDVSVAAKPRPRSELLLQALRPLTDALVALFGRLGVHPHALVVTHALLGAIAASLVALGQGLWVWAAVLLQAKTLLDNLDGGVARATGRVTRLGRYLDSVLDMFVNLLLFAALALHGPGAWAWPLAALAALALTLILSLDFNLEQRYKALRAAPGQPEQRAPVGGPPSVYRFFRGAYQRLLAPQDRVLARLDEALFERVAGRPYEQAQLESRLAWSDMFSTATLVNLGLSTQLLVLGVCLVVGAPFAYVWFVLAAFAYALAVQAARVWRFKRFSEGAT